MNEQDKILDEIIPEQLIWYGHVENGPNAITKNHD